jgi:hypothetical protein
MSEQRVKKFYTGDVRKEWRRLVRDAVISFLQNLVCIPSFDSNIRKVAARVELL